MKSFVTTLLTLSFCVSVSLAEEPNPGNPTDPERYTLESRLIFFSVLEGLYESGVTGEALELLIPNPDGMWVEGEPERTNFVYACPVCTPAFDAIRLYHSRNAFYGQKATRYDTFGQGLSKETMAKLQDSPEIRRKTIRSLIEIWVSKRLQSMALTAEERTSISQNLEKMKDKGEAILKNFQEGGNGDALAEQYKDWKFCPFCDGAAAAGKM